MTPPGNASFSENDPQQQSRFWKWPPTKMQTGPPPPPPPSQVINDQPLSSILYLLWNNVR